MHDPERSEERRRTQRAGGEAKATARRVVRQWTAIGEQIDSGDLPAILRACILAVRSGQLEPSQATAIMGLAKAAVSIANDVELEARISALEEAAGLAKAPQNVRRIA